MDAEFDFDKKAYNERIRSFVDDGEFDKVGEAIRPYIRVKLYEDSFADQILAVRPVTENDLQVDTETDSYYVLTDVEQGTEQATVANFRDRPYERYLYGNRFEIPLGEHQTPIVQKNKEELMAYDYDLLADAADKDVYELGIQRDVKLLTILNECVRISGKTTDVTDDAQEGAVQIQKDHINDLSTLLESGTRTGMPAEDQLKATRMLINEDTRKDFGKLDLNQLGDNLTGEVFTDGFTREQVQGLEFMSSIKKRLLTEHERVTLVSFEAGNGSVDEDIMVEGEAITVNAASAAEAAQQLAEGIQSLTPLDGAPGIVEEVDGAVKRHVRAELFDDTTVRISRAPDNNLDDREFASHQITVDLSNFGGGTAQTKGYDRFDVMWAFPDEEFMGEIVRLSGKDVESEVWKTKGENEINRRSWEYFGLGIGNTEGVAKYRMQRARHLG
ncbi:hypothetical protein [Salinibacter ruber]|uniref:Uncharacterized protein n=1 Tax=Salinibacter ruber TaxID=146919 RepID=A0AAW5P6K8_9BACT|nr:hypothetical protein [Salinibacter ruber]MCS4157676.1 hypothetical protein [Salinibacter ruber]